jgi:glycosyltransferase involved in cell wall biosynthesis
MSKKNIEPPPVIPPVNQGEKRPLWSVMIPTYNCAGYLKDTLTRILIQDPGPEVMQIEVIDDHSTKDDPESVVQELGKGRIGFYRQPKNVGSLKNFETCIKRSKGYLVHQLHGDDRVLPGFYQKMQKLFENFPSIGAAFCRHGFIDSNGKFLSYSRSEREESGILDNWLERIGQRNRIQTPSIVVKREVYESLGAFRSVHYGEDWEMWVRIAAHYQVGYEVTPLAEYRKHTSSISGQYIRTAQNIRDIQTVIEIINDYLPPEQKNELKIFANRHYAHQAYKMAKYLKRNFNDNTGATAQLKEAIKMNKEPLFLYNILKFYVKLKLDYK